MTGRELGLGALAMALAAAVLSVALGIVAAEPVSRALASNQPEREVVTAYGVETIAYATVRRDDGTYRRMLVSRDSLAAVMGDGSLPDGTRILMETYYQPGRLGTVFHKRKVDGAWHYGSFPAASPDLSVAPRASCLTCHAHAAETDFTFTLPSLEAVAGGAAASDFTCGRGGRSPCNLRTYLEGALP